MTVPTITDKAFHAAAEAVTQLMNDEVVCTELAKLGYKVGDRVINVLQVPSGPNGLLNATGVVVGYQVFHDVKHVLVNLEKAKVGCTRPRSAVHSAFHAEIPSQKMWALAPDNLRKEDTVMSDILIQNELTKLGLYAGQTVSLGSSYEGIIGVVAGVSAGVPVIQILPSHQSKVFTHDVASSELQSAFPRTAKYSKFSAEYIKEAKKPVVRTPLDIKNDRITQALIKDNLQIGQVVYWKNSTHSAREAVIVGHDGAVPILAFNDPEGAKTHPEVTYKANKEECLHGRFAATGFPVFGLHKSNFETVTERAARLKAKEKVDDANIVEGLARLGFKLGDKVEFAAGPSGEPQMVPVTSTNGAIGSGIVAGLIAGQPVIVPAKLFAHAWAETRSDGSVHSTFAGRGNRFWAVHQHYVRKVLTPAERQATAAARLAEITAKFASKPFPEIAVKGLTIKKKNPIRADLKKAGYRIAAKQSLKLTHGMVCNLLKNKGASNEKVQALASILSSEYGKAALSMMMGYGIAYLPMMEDRAKLQGTKLEHLAVLGEELRIGGMTIAGNELIETIFQSALEVVLNQEAEKRVRVSSDDNALLEEHLMEETSSLEEKKRSA